MKKLKATVTQKDGSKKEIYVMVDDGTAEVLAQVDDKEFVNQYLIDEYIRCQNVLENTVVRLFRQRRTLPIGTLTKN